jgi:uncharacterized membrane protein
MSDSIDFLHNEVEKLRGSAWPSFSISSLKTKLGIVVVVLMFLFVLLFYMFPRKEEEVIEQDPGNEKSFRRGKVSKMEWKKFFTLYITIVVLIGLFSLRPMMG